MDQLPPDFAETLVRVIEPGQEAAVAEIIGAVTLLDDDELRIFLEKFAKRVRKSPKTVTSQELQQFLQEVRSGGQSTAT
jgi:hypothetical protein